MPRPYKIAAGLIVLLVLVFAAEAGLSALINPETVRAALAHAALRATGRELVISGPMHLRLGLAPGFAAEGIALANPPGFSRPEMATAKRLTARVALFSLLAGDVVVESLTIEGLDLRLERSSDGTPNWSFSRPRAALYRGGGDGGSGGGEVQIRTVKIDGGQLAWHREGAPDQVIAIESAEAENHADLAPLHLALTGALGGEDFKLDASTGSLDRLRGGPVAGLAGPWPIQATLTGPATLSLNGGVTHPDEFRGFTMALKGTIPDLGRLQPLLPWTVPPLHDLAGAGEISDGPTGQLRVAHLEVHAGASDLSPFAAGLALASATLTAPGPGQTASLRFDGTLNGARLGGILTVLQPDLMRENAPLPLTARLEAAGGTLQLQGTIPPGRDLGGIDLTMNAALPDLAALAPLAGRALPALHDVQFSGHAEDAGVKLTGVTLRDVSLVSSAGDLAGTVTITRAPRLSATGTLTAKSLDLDAMIQAMAPLTQPASPAAARAPAAPTPSAAPPSAAPPSGTYLGSADPFDLAPLTAADLDLTLAAQKLAWNGHAYRDLSTHLVLQAGRLTVNPFRASAPEGLMIGGLTIDGSADLPAVAVSLRSPALAAASLAGWLGLAGGATGTVQTDAVLAGSGRTTHDLLATATGHLGLAMVDGTVTQGFLAGLLGDTFSVAGIDAGGSTDVACFAFRANLAHGVGRIGTLAFEGSRLAFDGDGRIDLAQGLIDLHLRPRLRVGAGAASAPVLLRGPIDAPRASLDRAYPGGRVGIAIGALGDILAPNDTGCAQKLALARGGLPGPLPGAAADPNAPPAPKKKPTDILQGLFH